jgi:hypothetical protein
MGKIAQPLVAILVASLTLSGCIHWLGEDFDKATLVGQLDFGSPGVFKRSLPLPPGSASLVLAVPNYRCAPPLVGVMTFTVSGPKGLEFSERRSLSEFTWSYGGDSCDAVGYLYTGRYTGENQPTPGEMRLQIPSGQASYTVEIDTSQIKAGAGRVALVWFVYGNRVPGARIFGELGERTPPRTR